MIAVWLWLACVGADGPDATADALAPWPDDPLELLASCPDQPFAELEITCRVQAAAMLARGGDPDGAERACAGVPEGTWREECHFRAGEELGKAGKTAVALTHCARAGWFGRNCLTHTGWNLPPDPQLHSGLEPQVLVAAGEELLGVVDQALSGAGDGLPGEGRDIVTARYGYNVYVGTGRCEPAPARLEGALGVALRTGFGAECARLLEAPSVEAIVRIWEGTAPPPSGKPVPAQHRMGRYSVPILPDHEAGLPHLPVYGGGMRLVGATPAEDAVIAALEGLYWRPDVEAEAFLPWIDDPRPRVRWTAARLLRLTPSATLDMAEVLGRIAQEHADEGVRWHAADGLARRTFEPHDPSSGPGTQRPGAPDPAPPAPPTPDPR